jgi:hypothetical protein
MHTEVCSENLKGREHLEDSDVYGMIILKWTLDIISRGIKRIYLTQERDQWRDLVKMKMKLWVSLEEPNL